MSPEVFMGINKKLRTLGLQAGTWDKEPCKIQATCSVHMQRQLAFLTVTDPNFEIIGVQRAAQGAKAFVIRETLMSACRKGILSMAKDVGLWPKSLLTEEGIQAGLPKLCSSCAAPSAFHLLKWKSDETTSDWRFRLAITHAGHPLKRISRQIGRCLTVLLKELHIACPFWGSPSMLGVKDMWNHIHANPPLALDVWERDIDNAYWNLNKKKVADAVRKAATTVRAYRRMHNTFCFSIAKGGLRVLDRIGHAADRNFRVFTIEQVLKFVDWDLKDNTLFALWGVVMRQAKQGVPIGGYLSAQLMCIWALTQEINFLDDPKKELLIKRVQSAWPRHWPTPVIEPGPVLTFPNPAFVPRDKQVLYTAGMRGWFHPEKRLLLQVTFGDTQVDFTALGLWDSHPEGRVGQIIQRSPRTQHAFLRNYFLQFDSVRCHMAEIHVQGSPTHVPEVMQTRYMDNAYMALGNIPIPTHTHAQLALFVELLHKAIYDIPMKWEPTGVTADWCDTRLLTSPSIGMCMKGVTICSGGGPAMRLWQRWPDPWSPNCPSVLQSMIPALTQKTFQLHGSPGSLEANVRSIVQGCGFKEYKWAWWWMHIRVRFKARHMLHIIPLHSVKKWYEQGRQWAGQGGHHDM